jgi:hypothetical protein
MMARTTGRVIPKGTKGKSGQKLEHRTTEEVFLDHLELRKAGRLEEDIARNYAEDVIIVSNFGTFFGHAGVRQSGALLRMLLPTYHYKFDSLLIHKNVAFEEWEAQANHVSVQDGIDAFVIKHGKIRVQTIYYLEEPKKAPVRTARKPALPTREPHDIR